MLQVSVRVAVGVVSSFLILARVGLDHATAQRLGLHLVDASDDAARGLQFLLGRVQLSHGC